MHRQGEDSFREQQETAWGGGWISSMCEGAGVRDFQLGLQWKKVSGEDVQRRQGQELIQGSQPHRLCGRPRGSVHVLVSRATLSQVCPVSL